MIGNPLELHLDDSPDSQEATRLFAKANFDIPTRQATPDELAEFTYPRLLTSEGTLIGLLHIRLALG